jgi:cell wall-associated NlpC family hydrolase
VLCALTLSALAGTARADVAPTDPVVTADPTPSDTASPTPTDSPAPSPSDSTTPSDSPSPSAGPSGPRVSATPQAPGGGQRDVPSPSVSTGPASPSDASSPSPSPSPSLTYIPLSPNDGVGPDLGQYDEYLALSAQQEAAVAAVPPLHAAVVTAQAGVSGLLAQRNAIESAIWQNRAAAAAAQGDADDVVRELYQQGDGGLGAFGTVVTDGPNGFLLRLDNLRITRQAANGVINASLAATRNVGLAQAMAAAMDQRLALARGAVDVAVAQVAAAQATVASLEARLRTMEIVPPQVAIGPDGCPTVELPSTLRDGSETIGVTALCSSAVKQAATPQAALAITWAFQHLGAAYACGGAGRLLPFRMDCSSFVSRAYHEGAGLATSGDGWAPSTRNMVPWDGVPLDPHYAQVPTNLLRPGDLVLYDTCPQGGCPYKHVVMYLGSPDGGKTQWMIHTNSCGDVAKIETFWGFPTAGHPFLVARRVVPVGDEKVLVPTPATVRTTASQAAALSSAKPSTAP